MPQCHDDYELGGYPGPAPVPPGPTDEAPCHDSYEDHWPRWSRRRARLLRDRAARAKAHRPGQPSRPA